MITIKTKKEIEIMREGGKILAEILEKLSKEVKPEITTLDLDKLARELILFYKTKPAFLNYDGFPAVLCTSINDEVVHGIPSDRILNEGDIISLDMGILHQGFYLDSAITVPVLGEMSYQEWAKQNPKVKELIEITREALSVGIKEAKVGRSVSKIGERVQEIVEKKGFGVVRDLVGHGIGRDLHEGPEVPNFVTHTNGVILEEGMTIAIEPMITMGSWKVKHDQSGVFKTKDGSWVGHFEHTVAITKNGPLILTTK